MAVPQEPSQGTTLLRVRGSLLGGAKEEEAAKKERKPCFSESILISKQYAVKLHVHTMLLVAWSPLKHMYISYSYMHTNLLLPPPQKRLGRDEPERIEEEDEDSLDDYQPLGGGTERSIVLYNSVPLPPPHTHTDPPDDDMEAAVEGAFEGFNQSGGHNPFMGVEPMGERFV